MVLSMPMPRAFFTLTCLALILPIIGCASSRVTDPPRTATEQFLLSTAAKEAVSQLAFDNLRGRSVFVDVQYFAAAEQAFVLGELRARLLLSGVQLVPTREASQVVLEARSGGVGIDRDDHLLGIPSLQLIGASTVTQSAPLVTPELALFKERYQVGIASISYVAYWTKNGEVVASSGPYIGVATRDDWWVFGAGPRSTGEIPPLRKTE